MIFDVVGKVVQAAGDIELAAKEAVVTQFLTVLLRFQPGESIEHRDWLCVDITQGFAIVVAPAEDVGNYTFTQGYIPVGL